MLYNDLRRTTIVSNVAALKCSFEADLSRPELIIAQDRRKLISALCRREGMSYWHEPSEHPLVYVTLGDLVAQAAQMYEEQEFLICVEEGVRLSYRDVLLQVSGAGSGRLPSALAVWLECSVPRFQLKCS